MLASVVGTERVRNGRGTRPWDRRGGWNMRRTSRECQSDTVADQRTTGCSPTAAESTESEASRASTITDTSTLTCIVTFVSRCIR